MRVELMFDGGIWVARLAVDGRESTRIEGATGGERVAAVNSMWVAVLNFSHGDKDFT
jgi:hypothetical protein